MGNRLTRWWPHGQAPRVLRAIRRLPGCLRCGIAYDDEPFHSTPYTPYRDLFPLCETCWQALTVEQRLVFYELLLMWWYEDGWDGKEHEAIRQAVVSGL
jgi:hypothetical protein